MSATVVAHLISVSAYAGFQWTVHLVVYPQLREVPAGSFVAYERWHQRRISRVVGPLFALLVGTTVLVCGHRPAGAPRQAAVASAALLVIVLATTALFAVPLHRRLSEGWDAGSHRRLTRVDAVRVTAATANVAVAAVLALG